MSQDFLKNSLLFSTNIIFIEELYQKFLQDPSTIDSSWVKFFTENSDEVKSVLADYYGPSWAKRNLQIINSQPFDISSCAKIEVVKPVNKDSKSSLSQNASQSQDVNNQEALKLKLTNLVASYQRFAHLSASLDPLELKPAIHNQELSLEKHAIKQEDLSQEITIDGFLRNFFNCEKSTLANFINQLNLIYKQHIGSEFDYISNQEQKEWLACELAKSVNSNLSQQEKTKILKEVIRTERFEQFLHKRFPGAKRFSIEGGDSSINAIEKIIETGANNGIKKIVIGMAHRGRLNTLTGVMGKPYHQMIAEFKGTPGIAEKFTKSGDVTYHMGYASNRKINSNSIDLSLAFNPSHLEAVNSVVAGRIRAKQDLYQDNQRTQAMALLIHGDAAFAGQGSVAENLMMNGVKGYDTGGVLHLIVNNQIGFTANPQDSRSTTYSSDLAKAIEAPIFHINGDDVEAVVKVADIITRYRQKFKKDAVLDIICYRRYGHNEGDEPLYTQPVMYKKIKNHPSLEKLYSQKLIAEKIIANDEYQALVNEFEKKLNDEFDLANSYQPKDADWLQGNWKHIKNSEDKNIKTAIDKKTIKNLIDKIATVPSNFDANPKIVKQLEARKQQVTEGLDIDWGCAESIAFASLLNEGYGVRITGQDSGRGTFSHRHSILHNATDGSHYSIFSPLFKQESSIKYEVHDSVLSEYAVLGFEYGYSLSAPDNLTIWEAQFGDFANGAQIIFDQFIASSEVKWLRKSNLVMLLPHGYEGQGPEHSSARLERYLQACADNNLRVCNITNPANFFHALRRQLYSQDRKPLIIMSPKSLLRHKLATSTLEEFSNYNFRTIIGESSNDIEDKKVRKVVLCSGKIYYDLFEYREANKINDVAIIRLEQIYPFDSLELSKELKKYPNAQIIWCQEEPKNMGSWNFVEELIEQLLIEIKHKNARPKYVGRVACASPATGYGSYHNREQKQLIEEAIS